MQRVRRTATLLFIPSIVCAWVACDQKRTPTEAKTPPAASLTLFGGADGAADDGGGFLLGGTAQLAQDPENPANDVIKISTDIPPFFGTVSRRVDAKIDQLDNMLEFKQWFLAPKTCIGGSPRLQLAVDLDGDGNAD